MNCDCNDKNCGGLTPLIAPKIKHVFGNVLRLAIPLTLRSLVKDGDEMVATDTDFIPSSEYPVNVVFTRGKNPYAVAATMDGNLAVIEDKGKIPLGTYDITVECRDDGGLPYRFKQNTVLQVVDATAEAGIDAEIEYEATTWYLDAAVFLATTEIGSMSEIIDLKLEDVFGKTEYDANAKLIRFFDKSGTHELATIDSRPFIVDGTVQDVYIDVSRQVLVVVLNEDAGGRIFTVPLYLVFGEYYKKTEVESMLERKANINGSRYDEFGALEFDLYGQDETDLLVKASATVDHQDESVTIIFSDAYNYGNEKLSYTFDPIHQSTKHIATEEFVEDYVNEHGGGGGSIEQVQADWNESDTTDPAYIKNKPTIPEVPTNVSSFTNDAGYLTQHQDISGKVDKETGKGLSTNDYTTSEKNKLAGIAAGAEVNVQPDWNQSNSSADDYIKNKPTPLQGKSAFQSYLDTTSDDPAMSESEWVASLKGETGATGNCEITDAGDLVTILVNDLTTGGAGNILSAEMGKVLKTAISTLIDSMGEYCFPNGRPTLVWEGPKCNVTQTLTDVTSNFAPSRVDKNGSLEITLTPVDNLHVFLTGDVTVEMGGTDITSTAWNENTGKVTIADVTDDVVITAKSSTYVQSGLVSMFDGKNRGGTQGQWVDVKDNTRVIELTDCIEASDHVELDGQNSAALAASTSTGIDILSSVGTAEVLITGAQCSSSVIALYLLVNHKSKTNGVFNRLLSTRITYSQAYGNACGITFYQLDTQASESAANLPKAWLLGKSSIASSDVLYISVSDARAYLNGVSLIRANVQEYVNTRDNTKLGIGTYVLENGNLNKKPGKFYCVRVYDKQLSSDEILQNYNIDRKRFNLS